MNYYSIFLPKYLNKQSVSLLKEQQKEIESSNTKIIVIKGTKAEFCYGLDFNAVNMKILHANKELMNDFISFLDFLKAYNGISIGIVSGHAVGAGVGIVSACDITLASDNSSFQLSEGLFGLVPGVIMPFLLQRLTPQVIKRMVLTADSLSAKEALMVGLIDSVVAESELDKHLRVWLKKMNRCHTQSITDLKQLLAQHYECDKGVIADLGLQLLQQQLEKNDIQKNLSDFANFSLIPMYSKAYVYDKE